MSIVPPTIVQDVWDAYQHVKKGKLFAAVFCLSEDEVRAIPKHMLSPCSLC